MWVAWNPLGDNNGKWRIDHLPLDRSIYVQTEICICGMHLTGITKYIQYRSLLSGTAAIVTIIAPSLKLLCYPELCKSHREEGFLPGALKTPSQHFCTRETPLDCSQPWKFPSVVRPCLSPFSSAEHTNQGDTVHANQPSLYTAKCSHKNTSSRCCRIGSSEVADDTSWSLCYYSAALFQIWSWGSTIVHPTA